DFLIAGRDLQISAFRAPIFRSAYGDQKIPARWRCGLKTTRSEQNHTQRPAKTPIVCETAGRDLQISAFRAPIFRAAYGDQRIPARWRCGLKTTRSEQNHTQRPAKTPIVCETAGRDLQISAFRAPIFRSAYGDQKIPARWRCDLKIR